MKDPTAANHESFDPSGTKDSIQALWNYDKTKIRYTNYHTSWNVHRDELIGNQKQMNATTVSNIFSYSTFPNTKCAFDICWTIRRNDST